VIDCIGILLTAGLLAAGTPSAAAAAPQPTEGAAAANTGSERAAPAPAAAAPSASDGLEWRTEAQAAFEYESLSDGRGDWRGLVVEVSRHGSRHRAVHLAARETSRFSLRDRGIAAMVTHPLGSRVTAGIDVEASPTHHVLPSWSLGGRADVQLTRGYVASAGLSHRRYDGVTVNLITAGAERYFGSYRAAYTAYVAHLSGADVAGSHLVRVDRFYGREGSSLFGVALSAGAELEHLGSGTIVRTPVGAVSVLGRHWMTPRWALTYAAGVHDQGTLYTRRGGSVGVRYRF
jgi:YaiO family outer membrane protein